VRRATHRERSVPKGRRWAKMSGCFKADRRGRPTAGSSRVSVQAAGSRPCRN
jgi:hypothetical protein